jgi:hypothetical protein
MRLHLCQECEKGNHKECWQVQRAPSGQYGGSKCVCRCNGHELPPPITITNPQELSAAIVKALSNKD